MNEYYEEDEPIEDVLSFWLQAPKGLTTPPSDTYNIGTLKFWVLPPYGAEDST